MERTEPLNVRVSPELKAALAEAAEKEDRSLASLVQIILAAWLKARKGRK